MESFLRMMLETTVTTTVIAVGLLLLTPALSRRYSAKTLYFAWIIVLVAFLIPWRPHPAPAAITVTVPQARQVRTARQQAPAVMPEGDGQAGVIMQAPAQQVQAASVQAAQASPAAPRIEWTAAHTLFAVWVAGVLVSLGLRLVRHRRFLRAVKRWGRPVRDADMLAALQDACKAQGITRPVQLRWCEPIDSPMLIGLARPVILLPRVALSAQALPLVLRHELVHLRRGDLWTRLLLLVTSALHWFNPVMLLISRAVSFQCEASCDAEVMRGIGFEGRKVYGETIIQLIRGQAGITTALSTRYHGGMGTMKKRILHILDTGKKRIGAVVVTGLLGFVACAGMAFALATEAGLILPDEPETPVLEKIAAQTETYGPGTVLERVLTYKRVGALNASLHALMQEYGDPESEAYAFFDTFGILNDFPLYMEQMEAVDSKEAYDAFLETANVMENEVVPGLDEAIDGVLADAKLPELPYRFSTAGGFVEQMGRDWGQTFSIVAGGDPDANGDTPAAYLNLNTDGYVWRIRAGNTGYDNGAEATKLTAAQKRFALQTVKDFCLARTYLEDDSFQHVLVSDNAYAGTFGEAYTYVWVFDLAWEYDAEESIVPYRTDDHEMNYGYQIAVGLESGRIWWMEWYAKESGFANSANASEDWMEQTGLPYPAIDSEYIQNVLAQETLETLHAKMLEHFQALTAEERLQAYSMALTDTYVIPSMASPMTFIDAVMAIETADDLRTLIQTPYPGINEPSEGMGPAYAKESVLRTARELLDAAGYADYEYLICRYSWADTVEVLATPGLEMNGDRDNEIGPLAWVTIEPGVSVHSLYVDRPAFTDPPENYLLTQAEKDAVQARAESLFPSLAGMEVEEIEEIEISEWAYTMDGTEEHVATIMLRYTPSYGVVVDGNMRYEMSMQIGLDELSLYSMYAGQYIVVGAE